MYQISSCNEAKIPEEQGIYYFKLRLLNKASLGLRGNSNYKNSELLVAHSSMVRNLKKIFSIYNDRKLIGMMQEQDKIGQNSFTFDLSATPCVENVISKILARVDSISIDADFIKCMEALELSLPPIYIGIAKKQSLKARYEQHKDDFHRRKTSSFGGRVSKYVTQWSHIGFYPVPFDVDGMNQHQMDLIEDILQFISKPVFSLR